MATQATIKLLASRPKAGEKRAMEMSELLKWVLGAALVGGGARAAFGLGRRFMPSAQTFGDAEDLVDEAVTVPVDVTPEQMEEYRRRRALSGVDKEASDKSAAWYDNMLYTLGAAGGLGLGWMTVSQIMKRIRNARLNAELRRVRQELSDLTGTPPQLPEKPEEEDLEKAAAYDWLEDMAEKVVGDRVKVAGLGSVLGRAASSGGAAALRAWPLLPLAAGGYLTYKGMTQPGAGKGVVSGVGGFFGEPIVKILGAVLGPVAALVGLHSLMKGYRAARSSSTEQAKLKQFRRQIYGREARRTPHVRLVPRTVAKKEEEEEEVRSPERLGLNTTYGKAAIDRVVDQALVKYSQVTGLDPMAGMFGGQPFAAGAGTAAGGMSPAEPSNTQEGDDAILPPVQDIDTIPPPSPQVREQAIATPEGQQVEAEKMQMAGGSVPGPGMPAGGTPPIPGAPAPTAGNLSPPPMPPPPAGVQSAPPMV